jgi:LAS superfamily LD-carboxypeptidase LdcB
MNRSEFIKLTGLIGISFSAFPQFVFNQNNNHITYEELLGKGNPILFGNGYKLRKDAFNAFISMKIEAEKNDIFIKVVSCYRDFNHQNRIWERKFKSYTSKGMSPQNAITKIIEYSTIPGTSRHHWGTDLDIVDANVKQPKNLLNPKNFKDDACFGKFKQWMDINANDFGFYLVYTNEPLRKGFKYEPWHYSYKPLSKVYLSDYKQLNLGEVFKTEKIIGREHFSEEFLTKYLNENILDINPELL